MESAAKVGRDRSGSTMIAAAFLRSLTATTISRASFGKLGASVEEGFKT